MQETLKVIQMHFLFANRSIYTVKNRVHGTFFSLFPLKNQFKGKLSTDQYAIKSIHIGNQEKEKKAIHGQELAKQAHG